IPCGGLITLSQGTIEYKSKIFEETALGFTCLLYVTPEKLLLNKSLGKLCQTHLIIATSVFGIGIDMPDVHLVLHYNFLMNM
ncbi:22220_t:CDS:2, partial [Gigaspora margarita]